MGSVIIKESVERVGEVSITKVEYEFESYEDFASWQADKNKALTDAITSLTGGYGGSILDEFEDPETSAVVDINVKPKKGTLN